MLPWFFIACILTSAAATGAICPENSQEWELKCYLFVSNNSAFINAEIHCRSFGGHLASISNAFTNAFIAQQAGYLLQGSGTPDAWLGGTSLIDATNWTWTDHQPFTFANWANSSAVKEHTCTAIGLANGLWMSDDCFETKPYICIIDINTEPAATSSSTTTPATTKTSTFPSPTSMPVSTTIEITTTPDSSVTPVNPCPQNWTYFPLTSSCYLITSTWFEWNNAEEFCVNQSSHLVSIHLEEELHFVEDSFKWGWTGLYKTNGKWKWTDNSSADNYNGQTENPPDRCPCVFIYFSGMHNDFPCTNLFPAICKMVIHK